MTGNPRLQLVLVALAAGLALLGARAPVVSSGPSVVHADDSAAPVPPRPPDVLDQLERAVCDAVERVRPSVAQVVVRRTLALEGAGGDRRDQVATSGMVVSADGYVLSLGRVFESAESIDVTLSSGESRPAELVGTDDDTGLALLKIDASGLKDALRAAPLGTSKRLRAGSIVVSVSNPFGLAGSACMGNVAGLHRTVRRGTMALTDVLQITCPVNPGDPGGVLADAHGDAVGIVASSYERSVFDPEALGTLYKEIRRLGEGIFGRPPGDDAHRAARDEARFAGASGPFGGQGIGFAIPIDHARDVVERLRAGPLSEKAYLGVQVSPVESPQGHVAVIGVREGSPAEKAGLQQFDVLLRFDGQEVASMRDFRRMVLEAPIGRTVEIVVLRGAGRVSMKAVLERRPKKP